jgi:HEAT repeat protein
MGRKEWSCEKIFFRLLNNKSEKTYWENINVLRRRPIREVFERCIGLIKSEDAKKKMIAIDILAQLGRNPRPFFKESIKYFFELLAKENDPKVIMKLLYAIGHNNETLNRKQIDKLCELKDTDNNLVKEGLVFSLLGINNPKTIDILIDFSSDKISFIRDWATFGLGSTITTNTKKIRDALWNNVNDKYQETKLEAIVGLALRKDIRVNEIIKQEIHNGEYGTLLFKAIIEIGGKDLLPTLKQQYENDRKNKDINSEWINDLKNCIEQLEKK